MRNCFFLGTSSLLHFSTVAFCAYETWRVSGVLLIFVFIVANLFSFSIIFISCSVPLPVYLNCFSCTVLYVSSSVWRFLSFERGSRCSCVTQDIERKWSIYVANANSLLRKIFSQQPTFKANATELLLKRNVHKPFWRLFYLMPFFRCSL